ncbi:hypothetical protein [Actinomadura rugatobispora]|uniref:Chromosome segregation ATPase n=1 Tax=Actinomadura rugatobispora TaxID=1994 RepID=A0ABW1A3V2_9ACTN
MPLPTLAPGSSRPEPAPSPSDAGLGRAGPAAGDPDDTHRDLPILGFEQQNVRATVTDLETTRSRETAPTPIDTCRLPGEETVAFRFRPCATCGRPVQQPLDGSHAVRYCQDNGGACSDEAQRWRERGHDPSSLTGQVAWVGEMVDRLQTMTERLAGSLSSELSVAGVERQVSSARAEAAMQVAIAQEERDASQRHVETAWRETNSARARAENAERDAAAARAEAEKAVADRDAAVREAVQAKESAEQAGAARLAAESERDHVRGREGELLAALENARSELVSLHARLSESETIVEGQRIEAAAAHRASEDLRSQIREAETKRGHAVADRDQMQARLHEFEQHNWQLSHTVDELRAAVSALTGERDAARAEAERARRRVDALVQLNTPRDGARPPTEQEPPTGLHRLNGMRLPHAG